MSDLRGYNLKPEDVFKHINARLGENGAYYQTLHIRCAVVVQNEKWRNALCLIRALPAAPPRIPVGNRHYANVHLLESYVDLSYLGKLVREMPTSALTIAGESIFIGEQPAFYMWDLLPSHNDYSDLPGYLYQSNKSSLTAGVLPQQPLVDFNMPFYRDAYDAIRDWIGLRQFHNISDARLGYVLVFLPQCRARLEQIEISSNRLRVNVARGVHNKADKLALTGSWRTPSGPSQVSLPIVDSGLRTQVPQNSTEVDLYLVDEKGAVLDYHRETPFWTMGTGRILPLSPEPVYMDLPVSGVPLEAVEVGGKTAPEPYPRRVFIVHGHDERNLSRLKKILDRFGLEPVILRSRPAKGRTIIEKFEGEAYPCDFAFVLMSPDDHVQIKRKGKKGKYVQARPNVIFEMGWLCRHLTRGRVCILSKRGTSIHSDLAGVELVEFVRSVDEVVSQIERELVAAELLRPK